MANVAGPEGGRTGPYWRRLLGITLPGERTQEELNQVNAQRQRLGLDPLGGPATAHQGSDLESLRQQVHQQMMRHAQPAGDLRGDFQNELAQLPPQVGGQGQLIPLPNPQEDLRQQLLNQLQPVQTLAPGRDALRRYVAQAQKRGAIAGAARKPILPPRPGVRTAVQARPY